MGSPPAPYYTNDIESKNNILKQHLQCKASQLEFVESMKALITEQHSEIEKTVATYGEYRVVSRHSNLACERQKWFKMSERQRQSKINQFMKAPIDWYLMTMKMYKCKYHLTAYCFLQIWQKLFGAEPMLLWEMKQL